MSENQFAYLLIGLLIVAAFVLPGLLMNRAIRAVIRILRQKGAVDAEHAQTAEELELAPKPYLQRVFSRKDYKPRALDGSVVLPQLRDSGTLTALQLMTKGMPRAACASTTPT